MIIRSRTVAAALAICGALCFGAPHALAQTASADPAALAVPDTLPTGAITGIVLDDATGVPLAGVTLELESRGRSETSHTDGRFLLGSLQPGSYRIALRRVGYAPSALDVQVVSHDTTRLTVRMRPSAFEMAGVIVTAGGRPQRPGEVFQPASSLGGAELRRRLETSVAGTLAGEPGITERYNGPAASQPVIRGLTGERVLVLEDGQRPGDVAATGGDHAVSIDPLGAERIEVVRGAAGLLYGSNALGGVVNVIRDDIPRDRPEHLTGSARLQGENVNEQVAAAAALRGAAGSFAWRAALSGRTAGETRTPEGTLPSTDLRGSSGSLGLSHVGDRGFAGAALRYFALDYGVPGTFAGQTIPGAHEDGVEIEMLRFTGSGRAEHRPDSGPFSAIEADAGYSWYRHRELERGGFIGTEFGQLTGTGRLLARHDHETESLRQEGAIGISALGRDLAVAGSSTGTRPAREYNVAAFIFEEVGWGALRLQGGARYDWTRIEPLDTRPGQVGDVRTRDFNAVSASLAGLVEVAPGLVAGVSAARSFRTPAIAELFSDGPHLADYSYDIGNPALDPEIGFGVDLFARLEGDRIRGEAALFRNDINGFIHHQPTGEMDPRFGRFPLYRAAQADARLVGGEVKVEWEAAPSLVLHGQGSQVRGTLVDDDEPLPAIPPMQGAIGARYERPGWFAGAEWRLAAQQDRVAEHELATDGHQRIDLSAGLRWSTAGRLHSLTLGVANLTDTAWRDHLSRIRAVAPQPGRNIRLMYHVEL